MHKFDGVKKILVIKLRHIGDVLLSVPVFRALRETFPCAHISALVNAGTEDVLAGNPLIDEVIVFDRKVKSESFVKKLAREISFLRKIREKGFDMAVDLTSGDRAALLALVTGARYRIAYDPQGGGFPGKRYLYTHLAARDAGPPHMVTQNLSTVGQFGIATDNTDVDFFIPEEARGFVRDILKARSVRQSDRLVHIHPTSRWLFKCWKDEYMAGVIKWLLSKKVAVIVTSSPSRQEMARAKNILALAGEDARLIDLCGITTIKQLAAISATSDLFIGVDSAPMHIAAAVGTPVIALFGPTGDLQWGPWGEQHVVFTKKMHCKPCPGSRCSGVEVRKCLEEITMDEVIAGASRMLKFKTARPGNRRSGRGE
jgi:heptosyltransferase-3